ncbi:MAG: PAQR family membrane homeostasis protein TrhA [Bacteroidota bacterium]
MSNKTLKDPISGLTHLIGVVLSFIGLILMVYRAAVAGKPWHVVSYAVFGASMILLYTASTLYHWLPLSPKGTKILRKLDHIMIFILIAGTYTPICLVPLQGPWGWSLFGSIWGLALAGLFLKLFWLEAPRWFSTIVYAVMGWLVIIAAWPLIRVLPLAGFSWLLAGGLFYSVGAVMYGIKKPNPLPGVFGFHEIFHIFVLLGSFCHFWLMYRYIMEI